MSRQIDYQGQNLPMWATEITQQEVAKSLAKLTKDRAMLDRLNKHMDKLVNQSKKFHDENEDRHDDHKMWNEKRDRILSDIQKNTQHGGVGVAILGSLVSDFKLLGKATVALGLSFITGASFVVSSTKNMGESLTRLMETGVGLDGVSGSTIRAITDLNRLGMSAQQVTEVLESQAGIVQALSKEGFVQINTEFARLTNQGAKFGLTMLDATKILGDDLKIRQQLGLLDQLDRNQQARMSRDLYEQQLQATRILGRTIHEIRDASRNTMDQNASAALRFQEISARLGPVAANEFITGFQGLMGDMAGRGISQSIIDMIGSEMTAAVPFADNQDLFRVFSLVDAELNDLVVQFNRLSLVNPAAALTVGEDMMNRMVSAAESMDPDQFKVFQAQLVNTGEAGRQLALSFGEQRQAAARLATMTPEEHTARDQLIESTRTLTNAMNTIRGSLGGLFSEFSASLMAAPLQSFASALNNHTYALDQDGKIIMENGRKVIQTNSILSTFQNVMSNVSQAVSDRISKLTGSKGLGGLAELIQNRINPVIERMGDFLVEFIAGGGIESTIDGVITTFRLLGQAASGLANVIGRILDFIAPQTTQRNAETGEEETVRNISWTRIIGSVLALSAVKALIIALAVGGIKALGAKATGSIGMLAGGKAVGAAAAGGAAVKGGAAVGGIGGVLKGLGGGLLKGIAGGLTLFANPKILAGAGILAGSIVLIAGAVSLSALMLGKSLPVFAEGMKSFEELDGDKLAATGKGILALSAAIAAFGVGTTVGVVGGLAGRAIDGIIGIFGGESSMDAMIRKLKQFQEHKLETDQIEKNTQAINFFAEAMNTFGDIPSGRGERRQIRRISALLDEIKDEKLKEKISAFGTGVSNTTESSITQLIKMIGNVNEVLSSLKEVTANFHARNHISQVVQLLEAVNQGGLKNQINEFGNFTIDEKVATRLQTIIRTVGSVTEVTTMFGDIKASFHARNHISQVVQLLEAINDSKLKNQINEFGNFTIDSNVASSLIQVISTVKSVTDLTELLGNISADFQSRMHIERMVLLLNAINASDLKNQINEFGNFTIDSNVASRLTQIVNTVKSVTEATESLSQINASFQARVHVERVVLMLNAINASDLKKQINEFGNFTIQEGVSDQINSVLSVLGQIGQVTGTLGELPKESDITKHVTSARTVMDQLSSSAFQTSLASIAANTVPQNARNSVERLNQFIGLVGQTINAVEEVSDLSSFDRFFSKIKELLGNNQALSAPEPIESTSIFETILDSLSMSVDSDSREIKAQADSNAQDLIAMREASIQRTIDQISRTDNPRIKSALQRVLRSKQRDLERLLHEQPESAPSDKPNQMVEIVTNSLAIPDSASTRIGAQADSNAQDLIAMREASIQRTIDQISRTDNPRMKSALQRVLRSKQRDLEQLIEENNQEGIDLNQVENNVQPMQQDLDNIKLAVPSINTSSIDQLTDSLQKLKEVLGNLSGKNISQVQDVMGMIKREAPTPPTPMRLDSMQAEETANTGTSAPAGAATDSDMQVRSILSAIAENSQRTNRLLVTLNDSIRTI